MALNRIYTPVLHFDDINGRPLVGGKLYTYKSGTNTPSPTYRNANGTELNENPIPLNERGECVCFLRDGRKYKFVLKDALDTIVWEQDDVFIPSGGSSPEPPSENLWGHWVCANGWQTIMNVKTLAKPFYKAEGNLGGPPDPEKVEDEYPHLPAGLYHFDLELAFNPGGNTGYAIYDLTIETSETTLRAETFTFNDVDNIWAHQTQWSSGVFSLTDESDVKFYLRRVGGSAHRQMKVSHFFVHSIQ